MRTPKWRRARLTYNIVEYPNGPAIINGREFNNAREAVNYLRNTTEMRPGLTRVFNIVKPNANCPFCERDLADEIDCIISEHKATIRQWETMIWEAMEYYGNYLGEIAEQDYSDQGGSTGMVEGRFELSDDDIECAMFEALYAKYPNSAYDHRNIVDHWKKFEGYFPT